VVDIKDSKFETRKSVAQNQFISDAVLVANGNQVGVLGRGGFLGAKKDPEPRPLANGSGPNEIRCRKRFASPPQHGFRSVSNGLKEGRILSGRRSAPI
ncbi:MAG: hypothetical protein WBE53_23210, partial [Pseudolabrys sp.]